MCVCVCVCVCVQVCVCELLIRVQFFVTPWTIAHQAPLSVEFFRQEYWQLEGCHSLLQRTFLSSGSNPESPALQADSLLSEPSEKTTISQVLLQYVVLWAGNVR